MRFKNFSILALAALLLGDAQAQAAGPVISFQAPADNSYVATGDGPLWATVEDGDGVDAGSITLTANLVSQTFDFDGLSVSRTGAALVDGYHFVSLTASDSLANPSSVLLSFTVDTLTPTAAVFPADNAYTSISASAWAQISDLNLNPAALTLTVNGADGHIYSNGSITSTAAPIEGLNSVTLTASDLAGNTLVLSWAFTLDTVSPTVGTASPVDGALVASADPLVTVPVSDLNISPAGLTLTVNGAAVAFAYDGTTLTRTSAVLSQGLRALTLTASDLAGNSSILAWVFSVDSLTPTAAVFPTDNSFTSVTPTVWAQLSDANLDPGSLTITVNGADGHIYAAGSITSTVTPIYGLNSVTLTAVDLAGNTLVRNWVFTLSDDAAPPVVSAGSPTGLTNNAQLAVTVSVVDAGVGVSSSGITVTVNTQPVPFVYDGSTLTLTAQLSNGDQYVTVNAADNLGNAAAPYSFQFTLFAEHCSVASAPQSLSATGSIGSAGSGDGQFNGLWGVAFGPDGGFYTTEYNGNRVQRFAANGSYLGQWSGTGGPLGIAVDSAGSVYVADFSNSRISKFNADGTPNNAFSGGSTHHRGQGVRTYDVSVAPNGDIYASYSNFLNGGVRRMDSAGADLGTLGSSATDGRAVFADEYGYVYVSSGDIIRKYSADLSTEILSFATGGSTIYDIVVDGDGNVYATTANDLRVFGPSGALLATYSGGSSVGYFYSWGLGSISFPGKENTGLAIHKNKLYRAFFNDVRFATYGALYCGVDTILPHAAVPVPSGGATVLTNTALVRAFLYDSGGSGVDLASAEMRINGVKVAAATSHGHISYTATGLSDGEYIVSVDVRDNAGNSAPTLVWQFSVDLPKDTTPPTSSAPAPIGLTSTTRPRVSAVLADNVGGSGINAGSIRMTLNGTQVAASLTNSTLVYAPLSLPEGDYSVLVTFSDNAGNEALPLAWSFSTQDQYCLYPVPAPVSQTSWVGSVNMYGIAVNEAGQVYVNQNGTMAYYDAAGNTLGSFASAGGGIHRGFTLLSNGNVMWARSYAGIFSPEGLSFYGATGGLITATSFGGADRPSDAVQDLDGNFWVTDINDSRVYKYNSGLGSIASYSGFNSPYSVAVGPNARIYVADSGNHRIRVLNAANGAVVQTIGSFGSGNGQFNIPRGVAVDPAGYIYVSDTNNNRIQVFNEAGIYQLTFGVGLLSSPGDLAVKHGKIYVVSQGNSRVMVFSGASAPTGCAFDTAAPTVQPLSPAPGSITGTSNVVIRASLSDVLPGSGIAPSTLQVRLDGVTVSAATDGVTVTYTAASLAAGIHTVTVDVSDNEGNAAQQLVWSFNVQAEYCSVSYTPTAITHLASFGSSGSGNGQFSNVYDVEYAPNGDFYVLDASLRRVQRFSADGSYLAQWGSLGSGVGQFNNPLGLAVDGSGNVYVADTGNNRISKFDGDGNPVNSFASGSSNSFGSVGSGLGQFNANLVALAVGPDGSIYAGQNSGTYRLQRFAADGTHLASLSSTVATGEAVTVDAQGRVYFSSGSTVRRYDAALASQLQAFTVTGLPMAVDQEGNLAAYSSPNVRYYSPVGALLATHNVGGGRAVAQRNDRIVRVGLNLVAGVYRLGAEFCGFDSMPPRAEAPTPAGGSVTNTATPLLSARFYDAHPSSGVNLGSITVTVDGLIVPHTASAQGLSIQAGTLADGLHTVTVDFADNAGNAANQLVWSFSVASDTTPPVISGPSPVGVTTNANALITAALTETGSGIDAASLVLRLDGQAVASVTDGMTVSFTASALADGVHTVTVDVKDLAGNTANQLVWQFTVQSDATAPLVDAITAPTSAAPLTVAAGATIPVSYSFTEANPAYVSITVKDGATVIGSTVIAAGLLADQSRSDSVALLSSAATGVYDVLVSVVDRAGQAGSLTSAASVVVDATAPTASLGLPTGTVVDAGGDTIISLQLADNVSGVDPASVKLYLDGVLRPVATVTASGSGYSVSYTASGLSAGLHTVTVEFADVVGNAGAAQTWSFTMVRDNTPPVIHAILAPTGGSLAYAHASGTADVRWSYTELNPVSAIVRVLIGATVIGETVINAGLASGTGLTRTTAVPLLQGAAEGVYDARVELYDLAGQSHSLVSAASVVVDNQAPTVSAGLPAGGSIVQTASPVVQAALADLGGSGVDLGSVVLRLDGTVVTPTTLTSVLVAFNASGLADGEHTASVELRDRSGNVAQTYVWTFRTDVSTPDVAITLPAAGAYVRGTPTVEALATDAGSGVTRTAFYHGSTLIDTAWFTGTQWVSSGGALSPSASVLWDTTLLADGTYVLSARAVDLVGNTGTSSSRIVTVDNTPPVVVINPVFSPTQYQSQTITGSITELNLAQLRVNGALATLGGSAPNWTYTAVVPLNPGANGVTVTASDLGGNEHSVVTGITMDPTAAVHFVHPAPGSIFRASTGIEVTAPPTTNTLSLEVSPDNGSTWHSVATPAVASAVTTLNKNVINGWRHTWDTINDGLADGNASYQLRAVAYDQHGTQLGVAVVSGISTDNTVPTLSFVTLPAPVLVGSNLEVYQPNIVNQGSVTETGTGQVRVLVEHYNATNDHVSDSPAWLPLLGDLRFSRDERLVEGFNRIVYTVVDGAGNSASASRELWYVLPQNSGNICGPGGTLTTPDGTSINVPSGALLSCADLSITTVLRSLMASPADSFLKIVGEGRQIDPVSLVFQTQAVLTLPYTDADLDPDLTGNPYDPATLRVLFWDGSLWQNKGVDSIDTVTRRVTVRTNHLGLFALAADTAPTPAEPKVYLTRNPFRYGTDRPTAFVYEMPVPGRVTIKIYDKTGDLVRTLVEGLPQTEGRFTQVWDGLNNFDRFVGSGIYLFRFEAVLSNGSTKTLTKAIGVLK